MIAKVALILAVVAAAHANGIITGHLVNTGVSATSMKQDGAGNYAFGYDIKDAATGSTNSRREVGNGHVGMVVAAAPIAYGVGHGAGLIGLGNGIGLGYGNGIGLGYGNGIGLGYGNGIGLGNGMGLGLGHGMGLGLGRGIGLGCGNGLGCGIGMGKGLILG